MPLPSSLPSAAKATPTEATSGPGLSRQTLPRFHLSYTRNQSFWGSLRTSDYLFGQYKGVANGRDQRVFFLLHTMTPRPLPKPLPLHCSPSIYHHGHSKLRHQDEKAEDRPTRSRLVGKDSVRLHQSQALSLSWTRALPPSCYRHCRPSVKVKNETQGLLSGHQPLE